MSLYMPTNADEVWAALAWGAVPSVGLLVGAIAGAFSRMPHQRIAMAMSVGAGLLLAGVSLKVAADAIRIAGPIAAALSLLLGAAVFSASNALLARFGAAHRKRCGECIQQPAESQQPGSGVAIALGNALDAVPEAMVLGIALRDPVVPLALVFAFSVGNLPVALSSTAGMRAAGRRYSYIFLLWSAIAIGAAVAIAAGYVGFGSLSSGVATAAAGIWSRSTARDGRGNDDSRSLPQQSALLRLARRLRFRPPAARRRDDALATPLTALLNALLVLDRELRAAEPGIVKFR